MVGVVEGAGAKGQLAADLAAGVNYLSLNQTVDFTEYHKVVLPLDGFVFWVRADLLTPSALINTSTFNSMTPNQTRRVSVKAPIKSIQGSLHYATELGQDQDASIAYNTMIFTALYKIDDFEEKNPDVMYIAEWEGIKFAFSSRGNFYQQADLYHYTGIALTPVMESQIVDNLANLDTSAVIVSNSLPIWLAMPRYKPVYPGFTCQIPLYPSFLVSENEGRPYGAVHIDPDRTIGLASAPNYDRTYGRSQLAKDEIEVTLYGCNNAAASNFLDFVLQYSYDLNLIGIMNIPVIKDEKRIASEFGTIAQKKTIKFEVSYHQSHARNIARQMIESTLIAVSGQDYAIIKDIYKEPGVVIVP